MLLRAIERIPLEARNRLASLADVGRKKRVEEAAEFAQLAYDLRGERGKLDLIQEGEIAWQYHTIGFTWRDEIQRYGEYRLFLAGYEAGKMMREAVDPGKVD